MEQSKANSAKSSQMSKAGCWIRALRLPFVTASALPFIAGTLLYKGKIDLFGFTAGLLSVVATHLGANLINDYADSKSGADWHDMKFYGFFGGSKLIQENVLKERSYLKVSLVMFAAAFAAVIFLSVLMKSGAVVGFYLLIMLLGVLYSAGPLPFSYLYLGEAVVFILFGPALVMGGYFIQSGIFPSKAAFILSLPFGLLTTAVLFANEVPDFKQDLKAHKFTWVKLTGTKHAYLFYYFLVSLSIVCLFLNVRLKTLSPVCLWAIFFIPLFVKAGRILKKDYNSKSGLVESAKLTIFLQTVLGLLMVLGVII